MLLKIHTLLALAGAGGSDALRLHADSNDDGIVPHSPSRCDRVRQWLRPRNPGVKKLAGSVLPAKARKLDERKYGDIMKKSRRGEWQKRDFAVCAGSLYYHSRNTEFGKSVARFFDYDEVEQAPAQDEIVLKKKGKAEQYRLKVEKNCAGLVSVLKLHARPIEVRCNYMNGRRHPDDLEMHDLEMQAADTVGDVNKKLGELGMPEMVMYQEGTETPLSMALRLETFFVAGGGNVAIGSAVSLFPLPEQVEVSIFGGGLDERKVNVYPHQDIHDALEAAGLGEANICIGSPGLYASYPQHAQRLLWAQKVEELRATTLIETALKRYGIINPGSSTERAATGIKMLRIHVTPKKRDFPFSNRTTLFDIIQEKLFLILQRQGLRGKDGTITYKVSFPSEKEIAPMTLQMKFYNLVWAEDYHSWSKEVMEVTTATSARHLALKMGFADFYAGAFGTGHAQPVPDQETTMVIEEL